MLIDFVNTGDPFNPRFPFTLDTDSPGCVEVDVIPTGFGTQFAFTCSGELLDGGTIAGDVELVTTVTEPTMIHLRAIGLCVLGGIASLFRRVKK